MTWGFGIVIGFVLGLVSAFSTVLIGVNIEWRERRNSNIESGDANRWRRAVLGDVRPLRSTASRLRRAAAVGRPSSGFWLAAWDLHGGLCGMKVLAEIDPEPFENVLATLRDTDQPEIADALESCITKTHPDLKKLFVELGNKLVTEYGFDPAGPAVGQAKDFYPEDTELIREFTRFVNQSFAAQVVLRELGFIWSM